MKILHVLLLGMVMLVPGFAGCQQTLFSDADAYNQSRIEHFYDGDSAELLRAQREKQSDLGWGFGFPAGLANQ